MATMLNEPYGRWAVPVLLTVLAVAGCPSNEDSTATSARVPPAPPPAADPPRPESEPASTFDRLVAWLDPDAVAVAHWNLPDPLLADAVAVVYGLPPRAEDLLHANTTLDQALEALRPTDAPPIASWLGPEVLVSLGPMARRPTILRPLAGSRPSAIAALEAMELEHQTIDAFEMWIPRRVFPYKVALLTGDIMAFISTREPGSGLPPLAAARDMPPSDVETQLTSIEQGPDTPDLILFAAGPMLHFDLASDVLGVRFELRQASDGAIDAQIALQVDADPAVAARALNQRRAPEQNDRIQELVARITYEADPSAVIGRLQLSRQDASLLHVQP